MSAGIWRSMILANRVSAIENAPYARAKTAGLLFVLRQTGRRPRHDGIDEFAAGAGQCAHSTFSVRARRRLLGGKSLLHVERAPRHVNDAGARYDHGPARLRSIEYLAEFLKLDAQRVVGARAVGNIYNAAVAPGRQSRAQLLREHGRRRRGPTTVRIIKLPRGILIVKAVDNGI